MNADREFLSSFPELFDLDFYRGQLHPFDRTNVRNIDAMINHFCAAGWRQGVSPSPLFCVHSYKSLHAADCEKASFNPVRHWIQSGARFCDLGFTQADFVQRVADQVIKKPVLTPELLNKSPSVAVVLHAFHKDQLKLCVEALSSIPSFFDIFVSTTSELREDVITLLGALEYLSEKTIRCYYNVGRDMAPFLVGFASALRNYDYVLKIHTKKSAHNPALRDWLEMSLRSLLGSDWVVREYWKLLEESSVGIIMPPPIWAIAYALARNSCWGYGAKNFYRCSRERGRMGLLDLDPLRSFKFPAGSMFWCKPGAIGSLFDLNLRWSSFDRESGQIDGTLAHGLERLVGLACTDIHGFECRSVWPLGVEHS